MLSKTNRLRASREVEAAHRFGKSFHSPFFMIKRKTSASQTLPRFAVVASTQVSKKAVIRNRYKRLVRQALRQSLGEIFPADYVVTIKPKFGELDSKEFPRYFRRFLADQRLLQ